MLGLGLGINRLASGALNALIAFTKAVRFPNNTTHYLQKDITSTWVDDAWTVGRTFEFYMKRNGPNTTEIVFQVGATSTDTNLYLACYFISTTRIRFAYYRPGVYLYRRDYTWTNDNDWHHFIFSHRRSGAGNNEQCWIDGVKVSPVSSAYVVSGQHLGASQHFTFGRRLNASLPFHGDLAYFAYYDDLFLDNFGTGQDRADALYNSRLDRGVRTEGKPLGDLVQKPEVFYNADDIVDLTVEWSETNGNFGTNLDLPSFVLDNNDIVDI